jgi:NAD(P)H-nitrite reductase large subunit
MSEPELDGAILQRDQKTYAIVARTPLGLVTPDALESIARAARKFNIPILKLTSAQRIALVGIEPQDVPEVWKELGLEVGRAVEPCMHYVQACPGTEVCRFGQQDSLGMGARLDKEFTGMDLPAKAKIGVSGCPMNCGESFMRDFGCFGKKKGWTVTVGGNAGAKPRIGDIIAEDVSDDQVVALARKYFDFYKSNAKPKERTAKFLNRVGIDEVKKAVLG